MKPWKRIEPTVVSKVGYRTIITKTFTMPDGAVKHFQTIDPEESQAAAILAITEDGKVIVCRQYRAGPDMVMDEIPGGGVNDGEPLEDGARRELLEETGYEPGAIDYLGVMHYSAYDNCARHCFLATGCKLSADRAQKDAEEFIELRLISVDELLANAKAGRMTDPGAVLLAYDKLMALKEGK
ncbi:MAG TPA: NUDIX hydrolase [Candidatus Saccharimonadales bacterium]|nr:NUDIX hydrolase [Candidatus Saccharimonadales bacterium]